MSTLFARVFICFGLFLRPSLPGFLSQNKFLLTQLLHGASESHCVHVRQHHMEQVTGKLTFLFVRLQASHAMFVCFRAI